MHAYVMGVADVFPCNVMWTGEDLLMDTGEVLGGDEDGFYQTCLDGTWHPIGRAA
jgi:hypothetical protein